MNNKVVAVLAFIAGAVAGTAVTYKLVTNKYDKLIDEEVQSVKDKYASEFKPKKLEPKEEEDTNIDEATKLADELNYTSVEGREEPVRHKIPYVIEPQEFAEHDEYDAETLLYYSKTHVLEDSEGVVVDDWVNIVGPEYWTHFGEYEPDCAYFRNEELLKDFEVILVDGDTFGAGRN